MFHFHTGLDIVVICAKTEKENQKNTHRFYVVRQVPTSTGTATQIFSITEIGLHSIYNKPEYVQITKMPLYHEHMVPYHGGFASASPTYYFVPLTKEDMPKALALAPFTLNMSHMP